MQDEYNQIFGYAIRDLDRIHDIARRFIMALQVVDFTRQVLFNGAQNALVQKFRFRRAIKKADINLSFRWRLQHCYSARHAIE
ncbi:hypothetical protein [uncultured Ruegeria sp.]|uniref:hypothetical protein n=1 Tax=uncultured Ruegeria sp. TaxID=259304 RepID=UPI00260B5F15|nr:hypothetical protein [uncultured Ruegeria sp.]